jgi:hypothetical protein
MKKNEQKKTFLCKWWIGDETSNLKTEDVRMYCSQKYDSTNTNMEQWWNGDCEGEMEGTEK